jgi:hypothetical protein
MEQVEEALRLPRQPPSGAVDRVRKWAENDASDLEEELHRRAAVARDAAEKALTARGAQEAADLRDLITTQRNRVAEEFAKPEDLQGQLDLNDELATEAAQRRRDRLHWQRKVAELEVQLASEPERLREAYRVRADRMEVVGLLYLWPASN